MKIALILLAGGHSTRMGGPVPKTFITVKGRPIIRYSFDLLSPMFPRTIVVAHKAYHHLFPFNTQFAEPGPRRQDSVHNGFQMLPGFDFILIHDGARPLLKKEDIERLINLGKTAPAAALASPVKNTLKRVSYHRPSMAEICYSKDASQINTACLDPAVNGKDYGKSVIQGDTLSTVDRTNLFEVYTPQLIRSDLLKKGLALNITVTDDLSFAEALGYTPLLVPCSFPNIKLTYPSDLPLIEALL
ncbi:MAG: hypothetical protein FJZ63_07125 [Chlamydiae bacterium]|nr:hypothetical protein [Chlamydiota bacterium]